MQTLPTSLYPFVPSGAQFEQGLEFFAALGFQQEWRHEGMVGLRFGGAYFILQEIEVREWQENQMVTFEVPDIDLYWSELAAQDLSTRFPGVRLRPPTDFPWGREINIIDLAGVCWYVRQTNAR